MGIQSNEVHTLAEYFSVEHDVRGHNLSAYDLELELAEIMFTVAQMALARYPILMDATPHRVKYSLVTTSVRYYASAVDLCLRGNPAEAMSIMRSTIECMAYASLLKRKPDLIDAWVNLDEKSSKERRALFESDSALVQGPETANAYHEYQVYSAGGVHARWFLAEQATDFDHPAGWRIRHAERGTKTTQLHLLGIIYTMKHLVSEAILPLYLEEPWPDPIPELLVTYETKRKDLGGKRGEFYAWLQNPTRDEQYDGRIIPARGLIASPATRPRSTKKSSRPRR